MRNAFFDTETVGLYGPMAIIQAKFGSDEAFLHDCWNNPVGETLDIIREIVACRPIAHNITFDWQKITQFYNAGSALVGHIGPNAKPIDYIDWMAHAFYDHRSVHCLKPQQAVCTLLLAQKLLGGTSLAAKEIRVRKVPFDLAPHVAQTLNSVTELPEILFARRSDPTRWQLAESDDGDEWNDVVLRFGPSNGLKDIAKLVLGIQDTQKIGQDFRAPGNPAERGYAPYAVLLNNGPKKWTHRYYDKQKKREVVAKLWPRLIRQHVEFWTTPGTDQFRYALDDIDLLEKLYTHFDEPETDFDSELACQVASVRVSGFEINEDKLDEQIELSTEVVQTAELNVNSHVQVRQFICEALDPMEALVIADGCTKDVLKRMTKSMVLEEREECCPGGCPRCNGTGFVGPGPMPVVERAQHILDIRKHKKRLQLYDKLKVAKGAFPSFRVIGTKSGRMSGADGLNYHGIDGSTEIREIFNLDSEGIVSGGDMNSQELAISAAVMNDDNLGDIIRDNKKLHAIFAASANPHGFTYDQIMANCHDKASQEAYWYNKGKVCAYSILYGASAFKVAMDLGCSVEEAQERINDFFAEFPFMMETKRKVKESLEVLVTDEEGRMKVAPPRKQYIDSVFGFRRSFEIEVAVMQIMSRAVKQWGRDCKNSRINHLSDVNVDRKVVRRESKGHQRAGMCVLSAIYSAMFSLQGKILRAAVNHLIQSAGRTCTLRVQKRIWDEVQPIGIHPFRVKLMSVHDEIATTSEPQYVDTITAAVEDEMMALTEYIPLLSLDWATNVKSWYGVKAADEKTSDTFTRCGWDPRSSDSGAVSGTAEVLAQGSATA